MAVIINSQLIVKCDEKNEIAQEMGIERKEEWPQNCTQRKKINIQKVDKVATAAAAAAARIRNRSSQRSCKENQDSMVWYQGNPGCREF